MTVTFARAVVSIVLIQVSSSLSLYYFYPIILRVKLRTSSWMGFIRGLEEVSMNWIGKRSVTELDVSLNWIQLNMHFSKLIIQFHPVQWHFQFCDTLSAYPVHTASSIGGKTKLVNLSIALVYFTNVLTKLFLSFLYFF